ncbi:hypothetical protein H7J06_05525 [Mycobacterium hodleri]|uniref:hypothetical protein n=1 Tax=Mycolicibacterium hodleri TaxID=49897 RepID=UPI0021F36047|nr:hypothetical protein [Mycolicibacterium hodleri]MCV7132439.1 hypothetical protein [Mycolicibacterium hodleri]
MTSGRPQRERVILAHRRGARVIRTRVEVQEQTGVGDALVRGLVRAQLGLALRLGAVAVCAVALIPVLLGLLPQIDHVQLAGIRLNWLVLAVLVYPVLYGVGRLYVRLAEQGERDFVRVVDGDR